MVTETERQLLALYRELIRQTGMRDYCEDHDMASETWAMIDELEGQVADMS